jgi:hypothetical protein
VRGAYEDSQFVKRVLGLSDAPMKHAYIESLAKEDARAFALLLDALVARAHAADASAHEVLAYVADVIGRDTTLHASLGSATDDRDLAAARRFLRRDSRAGWLSATCERSEPGSEAGRDPPLTLGERKALASRPSRAHFEKLLSDPHRAVIERLLGNPRLTEDDVIRLVVKRPGRPEVLRAVASNAKWSHRSRIRFALVMNPETPFEIATPMAHLLLRQELVDVTKATDLARELRALCRELLVGRT